MGTTAGRRILVVDDHPDTVDVLAVQLEMLGHDCRVASCGVDALVIAATFAPEIAFVDLGLPDISGFDLARRLREHGEVFLVAFTGYSEPAVRARAAAAGFDRYALKPLKLEHLRELLRCARR